MYDIFCHECHFLTVFVVRKQLTYDSESKTYALILLFTIEFQEVVKILQSFALSEFVFLLPHNSESNPKEGESGNVGNGIS